MANEIPLDWKYSPWYIQKIYEEYKDFFKKYGININSAEDLVNNPGVFRVIHNYDTHIKFLPKPKQKEELVPPVNLNNTNGGNLGLPITGMYDESAVNTDTDINEPSGSVVVGPDKESKFKVNLRRSPKPASYVDPVVKPTVTSAITSVNKPRKVSNKPIVVDSTPVDRQGTPVTVTPTPTSNVSAPVAAPTLSSITSQAVRHNGGFDDYRRQSVLSALRAAGGISPAEAVQRGIIPMEALNYV